MVIDAECLGIPETEYNSEIAMSSSGFQKVCRDLTTLGGAPDRPLGTPHAGHERAGETAHGQLVPVPRLHCPEAS